MASKSSRISPSRIALEIGYWKGSQKMYSYIYFPDKRVTRDLKFPACSVSEFAQDHWTIPLEC